MNALIKVFQGSEITMRQMDGRWGMTAEQFGEALGFAEARRSVGNLIARHRDELDGFLAVTKLVTPGGTQDATLILDQGILILAMLARTERAKAFRRWVADLLMELRDGEKQVIDTNMLGALLTEVRELRERQAAPQDPKAMILASIAANFHQLCPSVQKIVVTTALSLPPEKRTSWTASQIADDLAKAGVIVSANKVGKVAGAHGIKCPQEEGECEYGYWATTSVNGYSKVVPQYQYSEAGRNRLMAIFSQQVGA